jgi:hypothetical protein
MREEKFNCCVESKVENVLGCGVFPVPVVCTAAAVGRIYLKVWVRNSPKRSGRPITVG